MDLDAIDRWASAHHGLITLAHLTARGRDGRRRDPGLPSRSAWYRAIDNGQLDEVHPGVARLRGSPRTREQRIAAAVLAVPRSLASHRSAAHLWGVERPDRDPVDLIVPGRGHPPALDGVVVHRPTHRADLAPSTRSGIATTNPLRMLCDLGAVDEAAVPAAVEHVVVAGYASPAVLRDLVSRHARQGRRGSRALREAVDAWPLGDKPADSVLEPAMARLLAEHGLPPATFHAHVCGYEVDFLVEGTPIVLECDGWEFHVSARDRWIRDRERDAVLLAEGHPTVRFTWEHVTRRAPQTAARIRRVIERWAPEALAAGTSQDPNVATTGAWSDQRSA